MSSKAELRESRRQEVLDLCRDAGVQVQEYNRGSHLRLFGDTVIDYWPGTMKAWKTGSNGRAVIMVPWELVRAATNSLGLDWESWRQE